MAKTKRTGLDEILHIAQLAAMEAGDYALEEFTKTHVLRKKPMSEDLVTKVDLENERRIVRILEKNFPGHTILTEERKLPRKLKDYIWWVDPLDGSVSYAFHLPYWGISLALIDKDQPVVGVVYFPLTRDLYWAVKGKGAYRNYERIRVSGKKRLGDGVVGIDYGYKTERREGLIDVTQKIIDRIKYLVTYSCTAATIILVAEGKLTGYIHHMARRFDLAAGALILAEAGGKNSDTQGQKIDWRDTKPVHYVATNGKIHHQLLKVLGK